MAKQVAKIAKRADYATRVDHATTHRMDVTPANWQTRKRGELQVLLAVLNEELPWIDEIRITRESLVLFARSSEVNVEAMAQKVALALERAELAAARAAIGEAGRPSFAEGRPAEIDGLAAAGFSEICAAAGQRIRRPIVELDGAGQRICVKGGYVFLAVAAGDTEEFALDMAASTVRALFEAGFAAGLTET
jgi:hypothetical protein